MNLLFDTHAFLWAISGDKRLSANAVQAYENPDNKIYISSASYWEICIKVSLGKLVLVDGWQKYLTRIIESHNIGWMDIRKDHCDRLVDLPFHHRDSFDRLLIVQARFEKLPIVTGDKQFHQYDVDIIW